MAINLIRDNMLPDFIDLFSDVLTLLIQLKKGDVISLLMIAYVCTYHYPYLYSHPLRMLVPVVLNKALL